MPTMLWLPSIAACGLDIAKAGPAGEAFPKWKGDLFAGGLAGEVVDRLRIVDGKVTEREEVVQGIGRVRDVATAPDGSIFVVLNGPDHVVRLVPAK
jgi:glucose/arabinose dehydrogenase